MPPYLDGWYIPLPPMWDESLRFRQVALREKRDAAAVARRP